LVQRTIHPPIEHVLQIRHRILAAGGEHKVPIIRAGLLAGFCQVLVTDEAAASKLLD
jgi:DNA-binding transcriptional regulator LsrR (DeoR family)